MKNIKFWVNDKTRMCSMTMGASEDASNLASGFREVTADEQDAFRAETKALKEAKTVKKGKGKAATGLTINATANEMADLIQKINK